jgi:hypothetical protein
MQHEFGGQRSGEPIHSKEYLFIDSNYQQIVRKRLTDYMPRCITEHAIRATSKLKSYTDALVQIIDDVLTYA